MPLDPTPSPAQPAAPAPTGTAAPTGQAPPAPAEPQTVTIPLETLTAFTAMQARLAQVEAQNLAREQQAQQEQATILAKKGDVEAALQLLRTESDRAINAARADLTMATDRAKRYAVEGELSRALAGQPLMPGAAAQLTKLWRGEFSSEPTGDTFQVRTPTFQSVGDFVAAQLASPDYAHFVRAQNPTGGTGGLNPAGQATPTGTVQPAVRSEPKTLSDAIILTMREMGQVSGVPGQTDPGGADGRQPRSAFGLRATSGQA